MSKYKHANAAIEQAGGHSFRDDSLPRAIIRFRQGIGRLIRSQADEGLVAEVLRLYVEYLPGELEREPRALPEIGDVACRRGNEPRAVRHAQVQPGQGEHVETAVQPAEDGTDTRKKLLAIGMPGVAFTNDQGALVLALVIVMGDFALGGSGWRTGCIFLFIRPCGLCCLSEDHYALHLHVSRSDLFCTLS